MLASEFALPEDEVEKQLAYPFHQPEQSYLTDGRSVELMSDTFGDFCATADTYLAARQLPLLADRIPIIAYGANASPARLQAKMAAFGSPEMQPSLQTVPNIVATIKDTAIVWHGTPGQVGSTFAELYRGEDTKGVNAHCFVQFMTAEQVALLHATEGVTYHVIDVPALLGSDEQEVTTKAYVAGQSSVLLKDGQPVQVSRPGVEKALSAMSAEEAVTFMLGRAATEAGTRAVREYVAEGQKMSLAESKERQRRVAKALTAAGVSRMFSFPGANKEYYGRADLAGLQSVRPDVYQLAEQSLHRLRFFRDGKVDPAQPDIMAKIRDRASRELAERLTAE